MQQHLKNFHVSAKSQDASFTATQQSAPKIQENSYDALSALPRKRKGKLDLRQVIDAARLAQFPNIDGFFLIYGNGDITPLIAYLKAYGKDVVAGVVEPDKNSVLCNKVITLNANAQIQKVLDNGYRRVDAPAPAPKKAAAPKAAPAKDSGDDDMKQVLAMLNKMMED